MPKARKIINNSSAQLWRNHSNKTCKQQVARDHETTCRTATQSNVDAATPMRLANIELQKIMETGCAAATESNNDAATPMRFASSKIQKTKELRVQQRRRVTLMQPFHGNLQAPECRSQKNYVDKAEVSSVQTLLQNWISAPKQKKYDFEAF